MAFWKCLLDGKAADNASLNNRSKEVLADEEAEDFVCYGDVKLRKSDANTYMSSLK